MSGQTVLGYSKTCQTYSQKQKMLIEIWKSYSRMKKGEHSANQCTFHYTCTFSSSVAAVAVGLSFAALEYSILSPKQLLSFHPFDGVPLVS